MVENGSNASGKKPDKTLGILGGMGPAASARFMELLASMAPAKRDCEHSRMIMYSDPRIPDRTSAIKGIGRDPTVEIKDDLFRLVEWGADILAVPCNTAHFFIDKFRYELPIPLVHIVEATLNEAISKSPEGAWLLSTSGTAMSHIYEGYSKRSGYRLFLPNDTVLDRVHESISLFKGNMRAESSKLLEKAVKDLWKEKQFPVVAACTEIPIAYEMAPLPPEGMISSLEALAKKCLERLYN